VTMCHLVLRLGISAAYLYFATCLHGTSVGNCGTLMEDCLTNFWGVCGKGIYASVCFTISVSFHCL